MKITDFIPQFYFKNAAEFYKPDYNSMIYQFENNKLVSVIFRSTIEKSMYCVKYKYDECGRISSESLDMLTSKSWNMECIRTKNIEKYVYTYYKDGRIKVTEINQSKEIDESYYLAEYNSRGCLLHKIEEDTSVYKMRESWFTYDFNDNLISEYSICEGNLHPELIIYNYDNRGLLIHKARYRGYGSLEDNFLNTLYEYDDRSRVIHQWDVITNCYVFYGSFEPYKYSHVKKEITKHMDDMHYVFEYAKLAYYNNNIGAIGEKIDVFNDIYYTYNTHGKQIKITN